VSIEPGPTTGRDILLLILYVGGATGQTSEPIRGRTRLMKMVFLFERELWRKFRFDCVISESDLPTFEPWHYGPFSKRVFDDIEFFKRIGFLSVSPGDDATVEEVVEFEQWWDDISVEEDSEGGGYSEYTEECFTLTETGVRFVRERLLPGLSSRQLGALQEFKARLNVAPLHAILRYVYGKYPDMTTKSKINDQVSG